MICFVVTRFFILSGFPQDYPASHFRVPSERSYHYKE